jgi:CAAX protease family protein
MKNILHKGIATNETAEQKNTNWRKTGLFILGSFAFSWAVALIMKLAHIDISSIKGKLIIAGLYMPAPALATFVIQKFIYKEGFTQYGWTFNKKAAKWILFTPLLFLALTLLTLAIIGLLGNTHLVPGFGQLDFSQQNLTLRLKEVAGPTVDVNKIHLPHLPPYLLFIMALVSGIIAGATVNLPFMFGEEFGWRGLMLRETKRLGFLRANGFIGLVWGVWHWPVILMGFNYPHHPCPGLIMMVLFTMSVAPLFAYIRIKTKSILGPCMLHGMINATGAMYMLYTANGNELCSSIVGWAGIIAGVILTIGIVLFDRKFVAEYTTTE